MDYPCIYELPPIFKAKVINRPSKECKSPYLADIRVITPIKRGKILFNVMGNEIMAHSPSLGVDTDMGEDDMPELEEPAVNSGSVEEVVEVVEEMENVD